MADEPVERRDDDVYVHPIAEHVVDVGLGGHVQQRRGPSVLVSPPQVAHRVERLCHGGPRMRVHRHHDLA
eukprot:3375017-Prymnesium_polylepis.1